MHCTIPSKLLLILVIWYSINLQVVISIIVLVSKSDNEVKWEFMAYGNSIYLSDLCITNIMALFVSNFQIS